MASASQADSGGFDSRFLLQNKNTLRGVFVLKKKFYGLIFTGRSTLPWRREIPFTAAKTDILSKAQRIRLFAAVRTEKYRRRSRKDRSGAALYGARPQLQHSRQPSRGRKGRECASRNRTVDLRSNRHELAMKKFLTLLVALALCLCFGLKIPKNRSEQDRT